VIILDENVLASQRERLRSWRVHLRQIGHDVGRKGMQDAEIIPLLQRQRRPTFFSRDRDFFKRALESDHYCLIHLDVPPRDVARYVRRLLRHPDFKTWTQRKGCVARISPTGISVWRPRSSRAMRCRWVD
jgi:hypothetical protein